MYWYSLVNVPKPDEFPGTGDQGNGILPAVKSQAQWLDGMKTDGCEACHQLGNEYTRTIPAMFSNLDPAQAWLRRLQSGQAAGQMFGGTLTRTRPQAFQRDVGRLDDPHPAGRIAHRGACAAAGHRAEYRGHAVGLGRSEGISAR